MGMQVQLYTVVLDRVHVGLHEQERVARKKTGAVVKSAHFNQFNPRALTKQRRNVKKGKNHQKIDRQ